MGRTEPNFRVRDGINYLFSRKNIPPWEFYSLPQGYRDLTEAMALYELELRKAQ